MRHLLPLILFFTFPIASTRLNAQSDALYEYEKVFHISGDEFTVHLDIDGAELQIEPNDDSETCYVFLSYNNEGFSSEVNFSSERNELEVRLDWHGVRMLKNDENGHGKWAEAVIKLPATPTLDFYSKIKAGQVDMELGGLRLRDFELQNWAGDIRVGFEQPNLIKMEYFEVNIKAGEMKLVNLGNANFEEVEINGGIGDLTIDFRGRSLEKALARIDLDVGETRILLPEDLGVKLKVSKFLFLSGVDLPEEFERRGRYYFTENFETARKSLYLRVSPGIGELQVEIF